jgi:hypothetical protein
MSNFDIMMFNGGNVHGEYVAHAKKFTKEEFLERCKHDFYLDGVKEITMDDIKENHVRYYVKAPYGLDFDDGCYSYCRPDEKGSFPVWTVDIDRFYQ